MSDKTPLVTIAPSKPEVSVPLLDVFEPLQPSHYLVHFYGPSIGDLERVVLTETLAAAAQIVRLHLEQPRLVQRITYCVTRDELAFLTRDDMVLASILPCEPDTPNVEPALAQACTALATGDLAALQRLFITHSNASATQPERLAA